jgi:hypothetical protein
MFDTVVGCRFTMTANGKHYVTPDRVNIVRVMREAICFR